MIPQSVFIVDDHETIRFAYREFLETETAVRVVGEAASGREALARIPECQPQIALIDISMEQMDGLTLTRRLRSCMPALKILVVSRRSESLWTERALRAGADGFVSKESFETDIVEAIERVSQGKLFAKGAAPE